jgi:hypothetical protein
MNSEPKGGFGSLFDHKSKIFFGNLMVPEFTCGKLILPTHFQRAIFCNGLRVKCGKLMLPDAAILWVKLHHNNEAYLRKDRIFH